MRDDFEQIVWLAQLRAHAVEIERFVLEAHRSSGDTQWAVIQRPDQLVFVDHQSRLGVFLGKTP